MNYIEKDGPMISDREVDKLNDYASDLFTTGAKRRSNFRGMKRYDCNSEKRI